MKGIKSVGCLRRSVNQPTNQPLPEVSNVKGCFDVAQGAHLCQRLDWLAEQAFQQIQHLSTVTGANVSSICFPCKDMWRRWGRSRNTKVFLPKGSKIKCQGFFLTHFVSPNPKLYTFRRSQHWIKSQRAFLIVKMETQNAAQLCTRDPTQILQIPGLGKNDSISANENLEFVSSIWQTLPPSKWCCEILKKVSWATAVSCFSSSNAHSPNFEKGSSWTAIIDFLR